MVGLRLNVLAHTDQLLQSVPTHPVIVRVDLRDLPLEERWNSNQFAEARFLLSPALLDDGHPWQGVVSARFEEKWPREPGLVRIAEMLTRRHWLGRRVVLAPALERNDWIADADLGQPGLTALLRQIIAAHHITVGPGPVPYANTFICHRTHLPGLQQFLMEMLTWSLDRWGDDLPFGYRCPSCGTTDHIQVGRYGRDRHIGFLAERLTMLYFSQIRGLTFRRPRTLQPAHRVRDALIGLDTSLQQRWKPTSRAVGHDAAPESGTAS